MSFPTLVYKCPGDHKCPGGTFGTQQVKNEEDLKVFLKDGYYATLPEAIEGKVDKDESKVVDNSPPTRDEAKVKADELGIDYKPNIPTKKLIELINLKLNK
jgi:hypothetical protein